MWHTLKVLIAALFLAIVLASFFGCAPKRAVCERNYGPCGQPSVSRTITTVDTTIIRPVAVVGDTIRELVPGDTIRIVDSTGRAELAYWRTRAGQLAARCTALPDTHVVYRQVVQEVEVACPPVERPWWQEVGRTARWALIIGLVLGVLWLTLTILRRVYAF